MKYERKTRKGVDDRKRGRDAKLLSLLPSYNGIRTFDKGAAHLAWLGKISCVENEASMMTKTFEKNFCTKRFIESRILFELFNHCIRLLRYTSHIGIGTGLRIYYISYSCFLLLMKSLIEAILKVKL